MALLAISGQSHNKKTWEGLAAPASRASVKLMKKRHLSEAAG